MLKKYCNLQKEWNKSASQRQQGSTMLGKRMSQPQEKIVYLGKMVGIKRLAGQQINHQVYRKF